MEKINWTGKWIGSPFGNSKRMPVFRKSFFIHKEVQEAKLYICGVGQYEARCNGRRIGDEVLEPAWTDYDKRVCFGEYELQNYLKTGENVIGVMLGNGMYHVEGGRYTKFKRCFGEIGTILQIILLYKDGTREIIGSDQSFTAALGPITFSCTYGGEDYDKNLEIPGWDTHKMKQTNLWKPAVLIEGPKGQLCKRKNPPLIVQEIKKARKIMESGNTVIYDIGENISGWVHIKANGEKNTTIRITPYEMYGKEGVLSQQFTGDPHYYQYTFSGEMTEEWEPRFTYYGFRYIKVELLTGKSPDIAGIWGKMIYPKLEKNGEFVCSNDLWNRIHRIITRAILCNTKSIFTDCPHREKLGWLEQIHLIGPGILYNYDLYDLFLKVFDDMKDAQTLEGLIPDIVPEYIDFSKSGNHTGFRDSPEWGSACILAPWYLYRLYGNQCILDEYYDMMKKYIVYLEGKSTYSIIHHGLGDWCDFGINPPFVQNTPVPVTATAIYYYDLMIMEQIARILEKPEDELKYHNQSEKIKKAFNREFFDNQAKRYVTGSQTANAMALFLGLTDKKYEKDVCNNLIQDIERRNYHSTGGDVGYPFLVRTLIKYGKNSVMEKMMLQTDAPSYGYQVMNGATTLCEEWNGNDPQNPSSSQNHFMLGAAEEWFYSGIAGFQNIHEGRTGDEFLISPYFPETLSWMKAWQKCKTGKIITEWEEKEGKIHYRISVPEKINVQLKITDEGVFMEDGENEKELKEGCYDFLIMRRGGE
ncbi:MAG: family 78 glycoside hydrolase catalytic domain [Eubacteriales bacterium]|nr:family 78 glycoside hydrolase catalytic domain [Eubacteriales bacterium]